MKRIACSVFTDDKAERNEEIEDNPFPMLSKDPLELLVLKEETLRLNIPNKLSILRIFSQNTDTYLIYATS
nr:MAG: hypothetical protein [Bacteriophage sp.]UWI09502.1 MAG: hypothetical protein [Bacteriophage sp.]